MFRMERKCVSRRFRKYNPGQRIPHHVGFRAGRKELRDVGNPLRCRGLKIWIPAPAFAGVTILRRNDNVAVAATAKHNGINPQYRPFDLAQGRGEEESGGRFQISDFEFQISDFV